MRIALVAPPWVAIPPVGYGGTEAVIDLLARGLVDAGHAVLLCTSGDSTCAVPKACTVPQAVGTVQMTPAAELRHVIRAYDAIERWDADVVHDHTLVGPIYSTRFDVPVVTTNHGPFDGDLAELYQAVGHEVAVVAISRHQASKSSRTRIAGVIHHGVDVDAIPFGSGEGGYAAFLGRMCPDKGVDVAGRLARAAGVPLRIAAKLAEPAEHDYFERSVRPLLGDGVEYVGEVAGADKYDFLGQASCLFNPLRWDEPFGMVMIEALACGTPIVATPRGSVGEIIDDGRTGFIRDDEHGLVEALRHVSALDRLDCRKDARRHFSKERMVRDHIALYERAIANHRASQLAGTAAT